MLKEINVFFRALRGAKLKEFEKFLRDNLLTTAQAAKFLEIHPSTLVYRELTGKIKADLIFCNKLKLYFKWNLEKQNKNIRRIKKK